MSLRRYACRRPCQQYDAPIVNDAWISDAVFTRSVGHFLTTQRRYGSNVPGPLEARRRLARRRNGHLAMVGGAGPPMDPSVLFGYKGAGQRTQRESPVGSFFIAQEPSIIPPPPMHFEPYGLAEQTEATQPVLFPDFLTSPPTQRLDQIVAENMPFTSSLEGVRELVTNLDLDLPPQPHLSRVIFTHIFEEYRKGQTWTIVDVEKFLQDPTLNTFGAKNFVAMVKSLATSPASDQVVERVFTVLGRMLWRGSVPRNEISVILRLVRRLRVTDMTSRDFSAIHVACYEAIWDGMVKSGVLQPKDLGKRTLSAWLIRLSRIPPTRYSLILSKNLLRVLSTTHKTGHRAWLQAFLLHTVKLKARFSPPTDSGPHLRGFRKYVMDVGMLRHLFSSRLIWESILGVTESLLVSQRHRSDRRTLLLIWAHILERSIFGALFNQARRHILQLPSSRSPFSSRPRRKMLSAGRLLARRRNLVRQKWLMRLWLVRIMSRKIRYSERIEAHRRPLYETLMEYDRRLRDFQPKVHRLGYMDGILQKYKQLGLPYTDVVLKLPQTSFEKRLQTYPHLLQGLHATLLQSAGGSTYLSDTSLDAKPFWIPRREDLLRHGDKLFWKIDVTAPDFANKVLLYTETEANFRGDLLWLLRRHIPFKIGLAYSWSPATRSSFDSRLSGAREKTADGYPILNPNDCLATLHSMALIFACSGKLTPQVSYRLTKWCYEFILDHGAPLRPTMVRALYHAGVYRWREEGQPIPRQRFQWILGKIREVEGEQTANALSSGIMFEGFRKA